MDSTISTIRQLLEDPTPSRLEEAVQLMDVLRTLLTTKPFAVKMRYRPIQVELQQEIRHCKRLRLTDRPLPVEEKKELPKEGAVPPSPPENTSWLGRISRWWRG